MAAIVLNKLNKHYGALHHAVKDVDLTIADKEFVALVGPSGCGKSTTLRMIAGLEDISGGEIRIGGRVVNHLPPRDRDIAMVFQNYALYQHMSVYDNLAFGLRNKKMPEAEIKEAIDRATGMLGLHDLLKRKPRQLSGGQQQRVALGRCIVRNPLVFLFDEPLSNLDAKLRAQMRIEIKRLHAQLPTTSVFVTHDQVEAMTLGDRVVVMKRRPRPAGGHAAHGLWQSGQQVRRGLHRRAGDEFPRRHHRAGRQHDRRPVGGGEARGHRGQQPRLEAYVGRHVIMGLRPEHLVLGDGVVRPQLRGQGRGGRTARLRDPARNPRRRRPRDRSARAARDAYRRRATRCALSVQPGRLHFFDPDTENAITA